MFDPKLSGPSLTTNAMNKPERPDAAGLLTSAATIGLSAAQESKENDLYLAAERELADYEADYLANMEEGGRALAALPSLFDDSKVSAEEEAELKRLGIQVERIKALTNPARAATEMSRLKRKYLNDERALGQSPEYIARISKLFNLKEADMPAEAVYGSELFNSVRQKYGSAAQPQHYVVEAMRNREMADADWFLKGVQVELARGKKTANGLAADFSGIIASNAMEELAVLDVEWNSTGAIQQDTLHAYRARVLANVDAAKAQIAQAVKEAGPNGQQIDLAEVYNLVDEQAAKYLDIAARYGTDPSMPKRMDELFKAIGIMPELAQGKNFNKVFDLMYKSGTSISQLQTLVTNQKLPELMEKLGYPSFQVEDMAGAINLFSNVMSQLLSDIPVTDTALERLRQHVAAQWSATPRKGTDGADAPPPQVTNKHLDTLFIDSSPDKSFTYLNRFPAFTANVITNNQQDRLKAGIRTMVNQLGEQLSGFNIKMDERTGKYVVWKDINQASGNPVESVRETTALNQAISYLRSGNGVKVMGGTQELEFLESVAKTGKVPEAKQDKKSPRMPTAAGAQDIPDVASIEELAKYKRPGQVVRVKSSGKLVRWVETAEGAGWQEAE